MKTALIGASGYTGGELLRLLSQHSEFDPAVIVAHSNAGEQITSLHPHLDQFEGAKFSSLDISEVLKCDLVFLAMPHGESAKIASQLSSDQLVVDLGADFRLKSSDSWVKYYGGTHAGTWVYGMPELPGARERIRASTRVANPGCYATAIALSAAPILSVVDSHDVVVVAASGTSGAGRSPKVSLLASEIAGSLTSYKFGGAHQHTPEIEESLSYLTGTEVVLSFTPILAPMPRGILATTTARLTAEISEDEVRELFSSAYHNEEFVRLLPKGQMPRTASVLGSNCVQIQCAVDSHSQRIVVSTAIDNLGKGAAGQAIQNANLIAGLPENIGLTHKGIGI
jgi:N-acetyl-gamma-glutamyl-phosphate reductase